MSCLAHIYPTSRYAVMPGLVPGIHVFVAAGKAWMASELGLARVPLKQTPKSGKPTSVTSPAMTGQKRMPRADAGHSIIRTAVLRSFDDADDDPGADGLAAFADSEALLLLHRDRGDQLDVHRRIVTRHDHF